MEFCLSTIAPEAKSLAQKYGLGLEVAEFCTAAVMDENPHLLSTKYAGITPAILHAPFNELFPCAIDPRARALARERYKEAIHLAAQAGTKKVVIHSGSAPNFYYDSWFEKQSILFWKDFLEELTEDVTICLENVLDTAPAPMRHIAEAVANPGFRICLDLGHAHVYSEISVFSWLQDFAPCISHFHVHNNCRDLDSHSHLWEGSMDMEKALTLAAELCPDATCTLEIVEPEKDILWLKERGFLD